MKKNNKFRNGGNSNAYSLNYKFDSISPAGKVSGTALDLIKKYNELAKEAHGAGDYVEMEVYRQYAEHYRKIVTEINERKNYRQEQTNNDENTVVSEQQAEQTEAKVEENVQNETVVEPIVQTPMPIKKKTFKIVEIKPSEVQETPSNNCETEDKTVSSETTAKPKRVVRRKKTDSQKPEAV